MVRQRAPLRRRTSSRPTARKFDRQPNGWRGTRPLTTDRCATRTIQNVPSGERRGSHRGMSWAFWPSWVSSVPRVRGRVRGWSRRSCRWHAGHQGPADGGGLARRGRPRGRGGPRPSPAAVVASIPAPRLRARPAPLAARRLSRPSALVGAAVSVLRPYGRRDVRGGRRPGGFAMGAGRKTVRQGLVAAALAAVAVTGCSAPPAPTAPPAPSETPVATARDASAAADPAGPVLTFADARLAATADGLAPPAYPVRTNPDGTWLTKDAEDWTAGFLPAALWRIFERTQDPVVARPGRALAGAAGVGDDARRHRPRLQDVHTFARRPPAHRRRVRQADGPGRGGHPRRAASTRPSG